MGTEKGRKCERTKATTEKRSKTESKKIMCT
jgi:hypothetical protein